MEHEVLENWGLIALQGAVMCLSPCLRVALCPLWTRDILAIPIRSPGCTTLAETHLFRPQRLDVWKVCLCPYRRVQSPRGTGRLHWRRRFRGKGRMYILGVMLSMKRLPDIHSTVTNGRSVMSRVQLASLGVTADARKLVYVYTGMILTRTHHLSRRV